MKRIISLALICALMVGMIPSMTFASSKTAGEELKEMGLLKGNDSGDLNEEMELTRAEMMVVLSRMNGVEDEAKSFKIPASFSDLKGHWAAKYIGYAEAEGWTNGMGDGTFNPQGKLTVQQAATYLLRALKYDDKAGDFTYEEAVTKAIEVGMLSYSAKGEKNIVRGDLFVAMKKSLDIEPKGFSKKLGELLEIPGYKTASNDVEMDEANAKSHIIVEITLTENMTKVSENDFSIEDKNGNELEIVSADLVDENTVWIETEKQTAGKLYTVTSGGKEMYFTGVAKDTLNPSIISESEVRDNITVVINFDKDMDRRKALDTDNYEISGGLEILSIEYATDSEDEMDYKKVIITTSGQKAGKLYTLTTESSLTDAYGNKVETEDDNNEFKFGGLQADTTDPEIKILDAANAEKISIYFNDKSDLSKETAEDISNYILTNKSKPNETIIIESAELVKDGDVYTKVNLRTTPQTYGNTYKLEVENVADKFGNVISKNSSKTFVGRPADETGPKVTLTTGIGNDKLQINFDEVLDESSAEDISNYYINKDLSVLKAELVEDSNDEFTVVELTTTSQVGGSVYKVTVSDVRDEFRNKIESKNSGYFAGISLQDGNPEVVSAYATVEGSKTYVTITFNRTMDNSTVKASSNYYFGEDIGYAISVEEVNSSRQIYKVRVNELDDTKRYKLSVSNVEDSSGNEIDYENNYANFVGISVDDTEAPEVVAAVTLNNRTIKVMFNRSMRGDEGTITSSEADGGLSDITVANNPLNYALKDRSTSDVVSVDAATLEDGLKTVILTLGTSLSSGHTYDLYVKADEAFDVTGIDKSSGDALNISDSGTPLSGGLISENGLELDEDDATGLVGGTSNTDEEIDVDHVYATSNQTVIIRFNKPVKLNTSGDSSIFFENRDSSNGDYTINQSEMIIDPNDDSVVLARLKGSNKFTSGDKYTAKLYAGAVQSKYSSETNDSITSDEFYTTTQDVQEPVVVEALIVENGKMRITFSKDMHEDLVNNAFYFEIENESNSVNYVEFDDDNKNTIFAYFNPNGYTAGRVYEMTIDKSIVKDILGFEAEENLEIDFSVSSNDDPDKSEILEVRGVSESTGTYKVLFEKAVKFTKSEEVFVLLNNNGTATEEAVTITKAYNGSTTVDVDDIDTKYVDSIEFVRTGLSSSKSHIIALASGVEATTKDAATQIGVAKSSSGNYSVFYKSFTGLDQTGPTEFSSAAMDTSDLRVVEVTFSENVKIESTSKIKLYDESTLVELSGSISTTASNNVVTINTADDLSAKTYTVKFESGAIRDEAGNLNASSFEGNFDVEQDTIDAINEAELAQEIDVALNEIETELNKLSTDASLIGVSDVESEKTQVEVITAKIEAVKADYGVEDSEIEAIANYDRYVASKAKITEIEEQQAQDALEADALEAIKTALASLPLTAEEVTELNLDTVKEQIAVVETEIAAGDDIGLSNEQIIAVENYGRLATSNTGVATVEAAIVAKEAALVVVNTEIEKLPELPVDINNIDDIKATMIDVDAAILAAINLGVTNSQIGELTNHTKLITIKIELAEQEIAAVYATYVIGDYIEDNYQSITDIKDAGLTKISTITVATEVDTELAKILLDMNTVELTVAAVEGMIDLLPVVESVTLENEDQINRTNEVYNNLSDSKKSDVENGYVATLQVVTAKLADLKAAAAVVNN